MAFVQFSKVSLAFGDRDILKEVSVNLAAGSKAALTGANGTGKSTLLKLLSQITSPTEGNIKINRISLINYITTRFNSLFARKS